jgi:hypothetical protein
MAYKYMPLHSQYYILSVILYVGVMLQTYKSSIKTKHSPLTEVMNVLLSDKTLPPYHAAVKNGWSCFVSYYIIYSISATPICLCDI